MKINRLDHVGIIVADLAAAKAFFLAFGLELVGEGDVQHKVADKITGLKDAKSSVAYMRTPDNTGSLELIQYHQPADENGVQHQPANTLGLRHICFNVDDIEGLVAKLKQRGTEFFSEVQNFEGQYKLCYLRGPEGIIVELAEQIK
jgi:catechol 2,3-dioxygenase-like lactoylglutathione lyase family enzyme